MNFIWLTPIDGKSLLIDMSGTLISNFWVLKLDFHLTCFIIVSMWGTFNFDYTSSNFDCDCSVLYIVPLMWPESEFEHPFLFSTLILIVVCSILCP